MRRLRLVVVPVLLAAAAAVALILGGGSDGPEAPPGVLEVVGHDPLLGRGMNSALALHGDHAYVGNRSDGSHEHGGVLVVDLSDPADPRVVGEIGRPAAGNPGETSRELRVWPRRDLLVTLNFGCEAGAHACREKEVPTTFRFLDLRAGRGRSPRLVATYDAPPTSHEFFLWADPRDPGRALLYVSVIGGVVVLDISDARAGRITELTRWQVPSGRADVHSVALSPDGRRAYLAALEDGVIVLDTSVIAEGDSDPRIRELTSPRTRPSWGPPGAHSAIVVPGSDRILTTEEAYGSAADPSGGCPWGWVRVIDARDERAPGLRSEYRVEPWNTTCATDPTDTQNVDRDLFASFSSHNPTATRGVALVTWHSAGLQAIDIGDPDAPRQLAELKPQPLEEVATEDPDLTEGPEKVAMWSYPIVRDGLIHVVDIRNGLYVLRYRGPRAPELDAAGFLEGNSNLGDPLSSTR